MTSVRREMRSFVVVLPLLLAAATIGFWGDGVIHSGSAPPIRTPGGEEWLAEPLPPTTLDATARAVLDGQVLIAGPAAGASPFLTAAEARGARWLPPAGAVGLESLIAAPAAGGGGPALRAVISLDGQESVLIDPTPGTEQVLAEASPLRVGDRLAGLEILEISGQHVLVKGEEGHQWLHLSSP